MFLIHGPFLLIYIRSSATFCIWYGVNVFNMYDVTNVIIQPFGERKKNILQHLKIKFYRYPLINL
jgi:hypothetical protein